MKLSNVQLISINSYILQIENTTCEVKLEQLTTKFFKYIKANKIQLTDNAKLYIICSSLAEKYHQQGVMTEVLGTICMGPLFVKYLYLELEKHIKSKDLIDNQIKNLMKPHSYVPNDLNFEFMCLGQSLQ